MSSFRFPLDKVLAWRRTQLDLAEAAYRRQSAALAEIDRARSALEEAGRTADTELRESDSVQGLDLAALEQFHAYLDHQGILLLQRRGDAERQLRERQAAMLEARRRCRLLERLKEHRLDEWRAEQNRELEQTASESYLAQFARRQSL